MTAPPVEQSRKMSPMMTQWYACKQKAKDALLLFRLGDFYEAFYEDAKLLSETVDVTLTQRQGIPMSGVPAHAELGPSPGISGGSTGRVPAPWRSEP